MRIGFVVNDVAREKVGYTTSGLALAAHKRGATIYYIGVGDLVYCANGEMGAHAYTLPEKKFRNLATLMKEIKESEPVWVTTKDLDVIMLRNDPSDDIEKRPWAQNAGVIFGQLAVKQGVIVLNDPDNLGNAISKMYFQHFPEKVRPKTIITRNPNDITEFFEETKNKMVLKPLQGSGGRNVFLVTKKEAKNINQIFEAISRDGYVVAQEYLAEAEAGDTRLFLINGNPILVEGKIAAIHRLQKEGEIRSNIHKGGTASKAQITEEMLELVELVKPKLKEDGMFLVGLDIVGSKLMEVNVLSPGGLNSACDLFEVDFFNPIMDAIEQKINFKKTYGNEIVNAKIATIQ